MSDRRDGVVDEEVKPNAGGAGDEGSEEGLDVEGDADGEDEVEGDDVDEAEADAGGDAGEGEADVADAAPRKRGASDVIRSTKRAVREEREARERVERELADERRKREDAERRASERQASESREAEEARIALMSDSERSDHYRQKDKEEHRRELQQLRVEQWDRDDKRDFRELCRSDAMVEKVKDRVEARYQELMKRGSPVSRETLADLEIGKMVRENAGRARTKQTNRAGERVARETTRPAQRRGEAPAQRARRGTEETPEARRRRLDGVTI